MFDSDTLTIGGMVTASAVSLTAGSISIPGVVTDGGAGTVQLQTTPGGTITEIGTLIAGTLSIGAVDASVSLLGATPTANQIATLGSVAFNQLQLDDGRSLSTSGNETGGMVTAFARQPIEASILDAGTLTIAGTFTLQPDQFAGSVITLSANSILISGTIGFVGGGGTFNLTANGGTINETGAILATALTGSATGSASFIGASNSANQIASLGNFTANNFSMNDGTNLAINGTVNGGPVASLGVTGTLTVNGVLTANAVAISTTGGIVIPGTVQDANSVSLITSGSILETGTLIADLLTGSAGGAVSLTGNAAGTSNQVLQLGTFTAGGFVLNDGSNLLISGTETAPYIAINVGGNAITLANGARLVTGGTTRPPGVVTTFPTASNSTVGAFLTAAGFTQQGNSFVSGIGGGPSIVRVDVTGAGNTSFDLNGGLSGPATWLILGLDTGQATGNVFVQSLDVLRLGATGSTTLTGSVAGLSGPAAAGAAGIQPTPNSNFRFNSCPIHSVNCVLLPTQGLPTANPLNDINFGSLFNPDEQDDLLLPIVSDQDY